MRADHVLVTACLATVVGHAWTPPGIQPGVSGVPKFDIARSPIQLTYDVRPQQYLGVIGRRAAWLGTETGAAELWVHPFELASDFKLGFVIPDYVEPIRGEDVARTIDVRPEITTITYSHATFTVRQHILAPLDEPGLVILLDVDTFRPLEIVASFQMVFQYAWPGAFGGQYVFWNANENAFVMSESTRRRNAVIGSPWITSASSHPAHALPDAPNTFVIAVDSVRARTEFIPIVVAAGTGQRDSVFATYRRLTDDAEALYRERVAHAAALLGGTVAIDTPNDELDLALAWSKVNLDEAFVCNPDLGCGLVAGWGPSGQSTRAGFGWYFGGDAAINSFAMSGAGLWPQVAEGLRFFVPYQRDDGKIAHEISQAAAQIPWFTEFPYAYYHADTTPYWIVALWRYWRASGDGRLIADLWPAIEKAWGWCLTRDTDGDGIIENGPGNLGAIEVGAIGAGIHQDVYLAAVWIEALEAMAELAAARGATALARDAESLRTKALGTLNERYWREGDGHHAFGILTSGETNDNLTVWPATAAAFSLLDSARADRTLRKLATDSISSDWGARMLSTGSPFYGPLEYNMGAVWPFVTGFVAWGQYNYRRPWSGYPLLDAVGQMTFDWARGRHPELLSGDYYRPLDTTVPHQFFATSMLVSPLVYGLIGWEPDAPRGSARLAPQLPPQWDTMTVHNLRVGGTSLDVAMRRTDNSLTVGVTRHGPEVTLDLLLSAPPGARDLTVRQSPVDGAGGVHYGPREATYRVSQRLSEPATRFEVSWTGGLAVDPVTMKLMPGQKSHGLRILDFRYDRSADAWDLVVDGQAGRAYAVRLRGEALERAEGATIHDRADDVTTIAVTFPAGAGRAVRTIRLFR